MTDGHTRTFVLWRRGICQVKVEWDEDELDWALYRSCVGWCLAAGVVSIAALEKRVVDAETYETLWRVRCAAEAARLESVLRGNTAE